MDPQKPQVLVFLSGFVQTYVTSRSLRSDNHLLLVLRSSLLNRQDVASGAESPSLWHKLPLNIRQALTLKILNLISTSFVISKRIHVHHCLVIVVFR